MNYKVSPPVVAGKAINEREPNDQQRMKNLLIAYPLYEEFIQVASVRNAMATLYSAYPDERIRALGGDRAAFDWLQRVLLL
jgi:hypothetical protein